MHLPMFKVYGATIACVGQALIQATHEPQFSEEELSTSKFASVTIETRIIHEPKSVV